MKGQIIHEYLPNYRCKVKIIRQVDEFNSQYDVNISRFDSWLQMLWNVLQTYNKV